MTGAYGVRSAPGPEAGAPRYHYRDRADTQHSSQKSSSQSTIDSTKTEQLKTLDAQVKDNGPQVVEKIVSRVLVVTPELHPNLKKIEA